MTNEEANEMVLESEQAHIRQELKQMTLRLVSQRCVAQALPDDKFVTQSTEDIHDPEDDLTVHIVASIDVLDTESPEEMDEGVVAEEVPHDSALTSVENLLACAEQQQTSEGDMPLQRVIKQRQAELRRRQTQQTLDTWVN